MSVSFDKVFGIHQYTMGVRNKRAEVLAGNLANAETPGYKARDLDFSQALSQETGRSMIQKTSDVAVPMIKTDSRHLDINALDDDPELTLKYRNPYQADTGNGNTVETNTERMNYMQNSLEYQASLTFLNSRITKLMSALKSNS